MGVTIMIKKNAMRLLLASSCFLMVCILIQMNQSSQTHTITYVNITCSCNQSQPTITTKTIKSLCSTRATQRGPGQKTIAISYFGPVENPKSFSVNSSMILLREIINEMEQVYSDSWTLRIYHDGQILAPVTIRYFECRYPFIDFCHIGDLDLKFVPQKIWRFLPAGDETVSVMASRDLDSPLTKRERAAIDEWLLSNLTFHSMRDHPFHAAPIMGGMWAFRVENDREFSRRFLAKILDRTFINRYSLNKDQQFLAEHLWSYGQSKAMSHASYWCTQSGWNQHHRPFPTERPTRNMSNFCFIGCPKPCCRDSFFGLKPCPNECRPKEHKDWTYC